MEEKQTQETASVQNAQATLEMVTKLVEDQKKLLRRTTIVFGIALVFIVAVVLVAALTLVPQVTGLLTHVESSLQEVDVLIGSANALVDENSGKINEAVEKINSVDFEGINDGVQTLVTDADQLVSDNSEALTEAVEKINAVDFEKLNQAINDLAAAVEPMARFASVFG